MTSLIYWCFFSNDLFMSLIFAEISAVHSHHQLRSGRLFLVAIAGIVVLAVAVHVGTSKFCQSAASIHEHWRRIN